MTSTSRTPGITEMSTKTCFALLFALACTTNLCRAQPGFQVSRPRLSVEDNRLFIGYDLPGDPDGQMYAIRVEVTDASGKQIPARTLLGDVGGQVSAGTNRHIVWDLAADSIYLDEEIAVRVIARALPQPASPSMDVTRIDPAETAATDPLEPTVTEPRETAPTGETPGPVSESHSFNRAGVMLQSAAFPGLGLSRINPGKPHWLKGIAGYGLIGGSIYLNRKAVSSYESYRNSSSLEEVDDHFNRSARQDQASEILAYAAIGIWVSDIIWTFLATSGKGAGMQIVPISGISVGTGLDPLAVTPVITLKYRIGNHYP